MGAVDTDHAGQRVVGTARDGDHAVSRAQHTEQCHTERMRSGHKVVAEQRRLTARQHSEHFLQLSAPRVVHAVACGTHKMAAAHAAVRESLQHFQLVVFLDFFQPGKLLPAQRQRPFVCVQQRARQIIKLLDHSLSSFIVVSAARRPVFPPGCAGPLFFLRQPV